MKIFQPNHIQQDVEDSIPILKLKSRRLSDFVVISDSKKPQLMLPKLHKIRKMDDSHSENVTLTDKIAQFSFDLQVCQATTYKMVCFDQGL